MFPAAAAALLVSVFMLCDSLSIKEVKNKIFVLSGKRGRGCDIHPAKVCTALEEQAIIVRYSSG